MATPCRHVGILAITRWWGGAELHTVAVARELVARGHRVTLLELSQLQYHSRADRPEFGGIAVLDARTGPARMRSTWQWHRLFHRHRLDVIVLPKGHFHLGWPSLYLAVLLSRVRYVEVEHTTPRWPDPASLAGWRNAAKRRLYQAALDRCLVVCEASRQMLVEAYRYRPECISVVPNGIDDSRFGFDAGRRLTARASWEAAPATCVIGSIARLAPEKRLDRLLRAFAALRRQRPDLPLLLVIGGEGPEGEALRREAEQLGVTAAVRWLGAVAAPEEVYPGFDLFALTSEVEAMPYALLEAMACERAAVAMEVGGVGEVVRDGVNGFLVAEDEEAFVEALSRAVTLTPAERQRLGQEARRTVVRSHRHRTQVALAASVIVPDAEGATTA